jgi:uncharacterized membrane protein
MPPDNKLESIRPDDPNVSTLPDPHTAEEVLNARAQAHKHQMKKLQLDMGALGRFLGSPANIPSYIAGILALASFIAGTALVSIPATRAQSLVIQSCFGITTLALGYLFGVGTGRKGDK